MGTTGSDKTRTEMGLSGVGSGMPRNGLLDTQDRLEVGTRDVLSQKGPDLDHPRLSLPLVCRSCEIWCMMVNTLLIAAGDHISLYIVRDLFSWFYTAIPVERWSLPMLLNKQR